MSEYLDAMSGQGKVIHSEFTKILVEYRGTSLPREQSGKYLLIKQEDDFDYIYLMAVIWGSGQVVVRVMDVSRLERFLAYIDHFNLDMSTLVWRRVRYIRQQTQLFLRLRSHPVWVSDAFQNRWVHLEI